MKRNTSGHFTLADNIIGVKIENVCAKKKPEQQPRQLSLFDDIFSFSGQAGPRPSGPQHRDVVTDIFGEEKAEYVADEVGSLKRCGMYVDHFLVKNKKYILLKHIEGMQLLKFVNTNFSGMPVSQQVETFSRIIQSCMRALMAIHERKIAHNDAQLKNFIIAVETYECTVIDFGSAFLDAKPFQMENDFLTLAREFDYFDRYFDQSEIQYAWLRCKSIFKEQSMCNSVDIDGLIRVIDVFTQQVMKMKTGTSQFVLSSPTSSSCSSSSTSNLEIGQTDLGQPGYTV